MRKSKGIGPSATSGKAKQLSLEWPTNTTWSCKRSHHLTTQTNLSTFLHDALQAELLSLTPPQAPGINLKLIVLAQ